MKKTLLSIGAALLFGFGAVAQNTLVADCESKNATKLGTYWYSYADANQGLPKPTITPAQGSDFEMTLVAGTNNHVARAYGTLQSTAGPGWGSAGIGFPFLPAVNTVDQPFNLTGATGVSFYIKSDRAVYFAVMINTIDPTSGADYNFQIPAQPAGKVVTIALPGSTITADGVLAQPSWASPKTPWDPTKATKLQWQVKDTDGAYDFSIDDVTILGLAITIKVDLQAAIYDAEGALEYAEDNNIEKSEGAYDKFKAAIAAAKVVMDKPSANQSEVDGAITTLNAAKKTFEDDTPAPVVQPMQLTKTALVLENKYQVAGAAQSKGAFSQFGATAAKGGEYEVSIKGTNASTYALTKMEVLIVDDSQAAGWWAELSDYGVFEAAIAAGASIDEKFTVIMKDSDFPPAASLANAKLVVNVQSNNPAFDCRTKDCVGEPANGTSTVSVAFSNVTISVVKKGGPTINKTALETAITNAETALTNNPNKSEAAKKTLDDAIKAAKAILNSATTQKQIDDEAAKLNTAKDAYIASTNVGIGDVVADKGEVVGYFTITGAKLNEEPAKGIFFVKYSNGTVEKRVK